MKKTIITVLLLAVAAAIIAVVVTQANKKADMTPNAPVAQESIVGCYAMNNNDKDIYTLNVASQDGATVAGTLRFKNFEKDSSSGTFAGTYQNGVLIGDYTFNSEGMQSVMEVAFKKVGDNFVRGYGPVTNEGTRFVDYGTIVYTEEALSVFKKTACTS